MKKQWNLPVYLKYFLSYLLICLMLIFGMYFIIKNQLVNKFMESRMDSAKVQLDNVAKLIDDNLIFLSQIDNSLNNNFTFLKDYYALDNVERYEMICELQEYAFFSEIIGGIVYLSNGEVISTTYYAEWRDECFYIMEENGDEILFDPTDYYNSRQAQLICLKGSSKNYLIYLPATGRHDNQMFFYILDLTTISLQMSTVLSEEITGIALFDPQGQPVKSIHKEWFEEEGHLYDENGAYCASREIRNGYRLVAYLSNDEMLKQIKSVFLTSYLLLFLLGILGVILIFVAMRVTYTSLEKLTRKLVPDFSRGQSHLGSIADTFESITAQNRLLQEKLENYRAIIRKSLFESLMPEGNLNESIYLDDIFEQKAQKNIFAVCIKAVKGKVPAESFCKWMLRGLGDGHTCVLLEQNGDQAVFLIICDGKKEDQADRLMEILGEFYEETGCMSAISYGSDSALDVPALYENAKSASMGWQGLPVVKGICNDSSKEGYVYPHEMLENFMVYLEDCAFEKAEATLEELFTMIDSLNGNDEKVQQFYIHSILIDILMSLVQAINQTNIEFTCYDNLYYETVNLCRSHAYVLKSREIKGNINRLLDLYKGSQLVKMKILAPLITACEENFSQPEFSIAVLAEMFDMSISNMSRQFKKEMNMNFSDYLWQLRLNKAKAFLTETDMSIEEVAIAVGYYSPSGFMRKFKQETGLTPTQYRMERKP